ncbi:hypothetical protein ACFE04_003575 [Oxalis oulophora]
MSEMSIEGRKVPSLVDLCVRLAIDNVRYLGDVGETDLHLLQRIFRHCSVDQLMHIEKSTEGRDLSPVTDELWKRFYEKRFGKKSTDLVIERMRDKKVAFRWMQLYEAKLEDMSQAEKKAVDRLKQLYKKEDDRNGPSYNVSHIKSNIMKKTRIEYLKSRGVANIAAMKKNQIQRNPSGPSMIKPSGYSAKGSGSSSSMQIRPPSRRS